MRFLHLADIHLGCRRYNLEERTKDFFRAWYDIIEKHVIPNRVDFVLIAGDFFDRRNIDPQAMNHAIAGLERLKEAGIPVVAIEGNHDQRDAVSEHSWMRSLSEWGFIKLLEPQPNPEGGFLPVAKLKELKQLVNYLALGHTHKRFDLDGWAFNPGSLEPTSIDEYKEARG